MMTTDTVIVATFIFTGIVLGMLFVYFFAKMVIFFVSLARTNKAKKSELTNSQIKLLTEEIAKQEQIIKNNGGAIDVIRNAINKILELKKQLDEHSAKK